MNVHASPGAPLEGICEPARICGAVSWDMSPELQNQLLNEDDSNLAEEPNSLTSLQLDLLQKEEDTAMLQHFLDEEQTTCALLRRQLADLRDENERQRKECNMTAELYTNTEMRMLESRVAHTLLQVDTKLRALMAEAIAVTCVIARKWRSDDLQAVFEKKSLSHLQLARLSLMQCADAVEHAVCCHGSDGAENAKAGARVPRGGAPAQRMPGDEGRPPAQPQSEEHRTWMFVSEEKQTHDGETNDVQCIPTHKETNALAFEECTPMPSLMTKSSSTPPAVPTTTVANAMGVPRRKAQTLLVGKNLLQRGNDPRAARPILRRANSDSSPATPHQQMPGWRSARSTVCQCVARDMEAVGSGAASFISALRVVEGTIAFNSRHSCSGSVNDAKTKHAHMPTHSSFSSGGSNGTRAVPAKGRLASLRTQESILKESMINIHKLHTVQAATSSNRTACSASGDEPGFARKNSHAPVSFQASNRCRGPGGGASSKRETTTPAEIPLVLRNEAGHCEQANIPGKDGVTSMASTQDTGTVPGFATGCVSTSLTPAFPSPDENSTDRISRERAFCSPATPQCCSNPDDTPARARRPDRGLFSEQATKAAEENPDPQVQLTPLPTPQQSQQGAASVSDQGFKTKPAAPEANRESGNASSAPDIGAAYTPRAAGRTACVALATRAVRTAAMLCNGVSLTPSATGNRRALTHSRSSPPEATAGQSEDSIGSCQRHLANPGPQQVSPPTVMPTIQAQLSTRSRQTPGQHGAHSGSSPAAVSCPLPNIGCLAHEESEKAETAALLRGDWPQHDLEDKCSASPETHTTVAPSVSTIGSHPREPQPAIVNSLASAALSFASIDALFLSPSGSSTDVSIDELEHSSPLPRVDMPPSNTFEPPFPNGLSPWHARQCPNSALWATPSLCIVPGSFAVSSNNPLPPSPSGDHDPARSQTSDANSAEALQASLRPPSPSEMRPRETAVAATDSANARVIDTVTREAGTLREPVRTRTRYLDAADAAVESINGRLISTVESEECTLRPPDPTKSRPDGATCISEDFATPIVQRNGYPDACPPRHGEQNGLQSSTTVRGSANTLEVEPFHCAPTQPLRASHLAAQAKHQLFPPNNSASAPAKEVDPGALDPHQQPHTPPARRHCEGQLTPSENLSTLRASRLLSHPAPLPPPVNTRRPSPPAERVGDELTHELTPPHQERAPTLDLVYWDMPPLPLSSTPPPTWCLSSNGGPATNESASFLGSTGVEDSDSSAPDTACHSTPSPAYLPNNFGYTPPDRAGPEDELSQPNPSTLRANYDLSYPASLAPPVNTRRPSAAAERVGDELTHELTPPHQERAPTPDLVYWEMPPLSLSITTLPAWFPASSARPSTNDAAACLDSADFLGSDSNAVPGSACHSTPSAPENPNNFKPAPPDRAGPEDELSHHNTPTLRATDLLSRATPLPPPSHSRLFTISEEDLTDQLTPSQQQRTTPPHDLVYWEMPPLPLSTTPPPTWCLSSSGGLPTNQGLAHYDSSGTVDSVNHTAPDDAHHTRNSAPGLANNSGLAAPSCRQSVDEVTQPILSTLRDSHLLSHPAPLPPAVNTRRPSPAAQRVTDELTPPQQQRTTPPHDLVYWEMPPLPLSTTPPPTWCLSSSGWSSTNVGGSSVDFAGILGSDIHAAPRSPRLGTVSSVDAASEPEPCTQASLPTHYAFPGMPNGALAIQRASTVWSPVQQLPQNCMSLPPLLTDPSPPPSWQLAATQQFQRRPGIPMDSSQDVILDSRVFIGIPAPTVYLSASAAPHPVTSRGPQGVEQYILFHRGCAPG
ncbi:hypothetical protein BESB_048120 [Besnoitia besnoiti]|uniref:Uncharacterized protein n=1 Tax=Besnoitia besnoiti TaxID=94643 RepID=A0A2A9MM62_BESBE|nr:hypothetical protein BESB_048120 [Besnoitia besnoiti]PFH36620.1 hypothetical protein BESB_048120 [Besnoitia besnoiti]